MGGKSSKSKKQNLQAETYYKNLTSNNEISTDTSPKEQVQINFGIQNCRQLVDYSIQIFSLDPLKNNYQLVGTTTNLQANTDNTISFETSFIIYYYFERQQPLMLRISRSDEKFEIQTNLGNIMGSRGQTLIRDIFNDVNKEKLIISATTLKNNNINIALVLSAKYKTKNVGLFYSIKKLNKKQNNNQNTNNINQFINVYKSEVKLNNNENLTFNKIKIPAMIVCNGDYETPILFEFHDYSNQNLLSSYQTTIDKLVSSDKNFTLKLSNGHELQIFSQCEFVKEYTFIDYLRGGLQLALSIGIDFTGSNGHPLDNSSLHFVGNQSFNSYEKAIRSCGDIVAYYDYDQLFPVYGYGAVLAGQREPNHCFPINFSTDPHIKSIDAVLQNYRNVLNQINFSGPTLFAPLLRQIVFNLKNESSKMVYQILLILTDGIINDMDDTIDVLVEASFLPLSVIIVGIGKNDFGNMSVLDADDAPLIDRQGKKSVRDLVQFVPFYQFENDGKKLAEQVLEEVPRQVVEYYKLIGMPPGDPIVNSFS